MTDLEKVLVEQRKIHTEAEKYQAAKRGQPYRANCQDAPYCRWLDTTPTYRILKALKGLKLKD